LQNSEEIICKQVDYTLRALKLKAFFPTVVGVTMRTEREEGKGSAQCSCAGLALGVCNSSTIRTASSMSPRALASVTVVGEGSQSIFNVDFLIVFSNLKFQAILVNSYTNNSFIVCEVLRSICFGISGTAITGTF